MRGAVPCGNDHAGVRVMRDDVLPGVPFRDLRFEREISGSAFFRMGEPLLDDLVQFAWVLDAFLGIFVVIGATALHRSEESRAGKECVSTCRSRWSPYH